MWFSAMASQQCTSTDNLARLMACRVRAPPRCPHVQVHAIHAATHFQVIASGVVADTLAHQRDAAHRIGRAIAEPDDGSLVVLRAPGHRQEGAGTELGEGRLVELLTLPALLLRQLPREGTVTAGIELRGGQYGQVTGQPVALRLGLDAGQIQDAGGERVRL